MSRVRIPLSLLQEEKSEKISLFCNIEECADPRHRGAVERAHDVRWTSVMRGPKRSEDRIPLSLFQKEESDYNIDFQIIKFISFSKFDNSNGIF